MGLFSKLFGKSKHKQMLEHAEQEFAKGNIIIPDPSNVENIVELREKAKDNPVIWDRLDEATVKEEWGAKHGKK